LKTLFTGWLGVTFTRLLARKRNKVQNSVAKTHGNKRAIQQKNHKIKRQPEPKAVF
jgi:hypothetical protein